MADNDWQNSPLSVMSLEARGWPSPRKQRLFAVACCRRIEHLLSGAHSDCLALAERYADRQVNRDELGAARAAVQRNPIDQPTYADHARQFGEAATVWACATGTRKFAGQTANCSGCALAYSVLPPDELYVPPAQSPHRQLWWDTEKAEVAAQVELIHEVCGDLAHPVAFDPAWRTSDVLALAQGIYDDRAFDRMPILADALQDAGCADDDVLNHCRGATAAHVRGCWVVDSVLGKQ